MDNVPVIDSAAREYWFLLRLAKRELEINKLT